MQSACIHTAAIGVARLSKISDGNHHIAQKFTYSRPALRIVDFLGRSKLTQGRDVTPSAAATSVRAEGEIDRMSPFLDSLKWDNNGLVVAIAQHVDTGEVLMQAFADRNAINETLQTG